MMASRLVERYDREHVAIALATSTLSIALEL
jgi:hypothetical protein